MRPLPCSGAGALGGSIVKGPFSWVNQGCWLGYFASVVGTVALVSWEVVIWPVHDVSVLQKVRSMPLVGFKRAQLRRTALLIAAVAGNERESTLLCLE